GLVDHDPLDPARPVRDDIATADIAVRDRLLEQRPQEVEHVLAARDHALVHEELGRRLAGHGHLPGALGRRSRWYVDGAGHEKAPRMIRPCSLPSTSATRTSRS